MDILDRDGLKVIHLTDSKQHSEAIQLINSNEADGINFNYIRNWAKQLDFLAECPGIKYVQINDSTCDYSIINSLPNLEGLAVYTDDRAEIRFDNMLKLKRASIFWRPKAASLFKCSQLEHLFLGKYRGKDLLQLANLNNLKYLRVNTGSIQSLKGIEELRKLEELWLMLIPSLRSLDGLQHLKKLKKLCIFDCKNILRRTEIDQLPSSTTVILSGTTSFGSQ